MSQLKLQADFVCKTLRQKSHHRAAWGRWSATEVGQPTRRNEETKVDNFTPQVNDDRHGHLLYSAYILFGRDSGRGSYPISDLPTFWHTSKMNKCKIKLNKTYKKL